MAAWCSVYMASGDRPQSDRHQGVTAGHQNLRVRYRAVAVSAPTGHLVFEGRSAPAQTPFHRESMRRAAGVKAFLQQSRRPSENGDPRWR